MTHKDSFFPRSEVHRFASAIIDANAKKQSRIRIPPPAIRKPVELWTGKQVSCLSFLPLLDICIYCAHCYDCPFSSYGIVYMVVTDWHLCIGEKVVMWVCRLEPLFDFKVLSFCRGFELTRVDF